MYDEDLTNLDEWVRRLKVEYDIFFNGNRKKPPDDLRFRVEKLVKRLAEATDMSFSQRFRYNTLIARFYVYRDLWRRTQMDRESALDPKGKAEPTASPSGVPSQPLPPSIEVAISDPGKDSREIRLLYDELLRMRGIHAQDSSGLSFQQFESYITAQTQSIRQKQGCRRVLFRIALEEKGIKFTAKADSASD